MLCHQSISAVALRRKSSTAYFRSLRVEPSVRLELLWGDGSQRIRRQLVVQTVDMRLETSGVNRPPVWGAHVRAMYKKILVPPGRLVEVDTNAYISWGEKSIFSRAWFHILRRFPAPFFLLYKRAYGCANCPRRTRPLPSRQAGSDSLRAWRLDCASEEGPAPDDDPPGGDVGGKVYGDPSGASEG